MDAPQCKKMLLNRKYPQASQMGCRLCYLILCLFTSMELSRLLAAVLSTWSTNVTVECRREVDLCPYNCEHITCCPGPLLPLRGLALPCNTPLVPVHTPLPVSTMLVRLDTPPDPGTPAQDCHSIGDPTCEGMPVGVQRWEGCSSEKLLHASV